MKLKNFFLKICLGTGLFFYHYPLVNNVASAVSLKPYANKSNLENMASIDLALEKNLLFIPLNDLALLLTEIQIENSLSNKEIEVIIESYKEEQPELFKSLLASLNQLKFDREKRSANENSVVILSQTNYSDIFQDVYDFETELTTNINIPEKTPSFRQNVINNQQNPELFRQEVLDYTYRPNGSKTVYLNNTNKSTSQISTVNSVSQNSSIPGNSFSDTQSQYQAPNTFSIPTTKIETSNFRSIGQSSIQKTPAQIELEKQLEKQREQLEKRTEKLKRKLEKEREQRAKQRAKEEEKKVKEQRKRLAKIAKQQAKLRNR